MATMIPLSQLQFARKYPFSSHGRNAIKQLAPQMENLSPEVFDRAFDLVVASTLLNSRQQRGFVENHFKQRELSYEEFLSNDLLAFPIAKILISYSKNPHWFEKFAALIGDLTFEYLVNEKDKLSNLLDLAQDMKLRIDLRHSNDAARIAIPLTQFIFFPMKDAQLHLVNQQVDHGMVLLETNAACRWLAEVVNATVLATLPVEIKSLPSVFEEKSLQLQKRIREKQVETAKSSSAGVIAVQAFPPCMDKLYSELSSGVNLPHMARFDLATFLVNIQMPYEDIVNVFAKASNYDERITRYHVENLSGKHSGKKYSAPSCAKVREHGLCISRTCNVMHPLQFYERESNPATAVWEKKKETDSETKTEIK